MARRISRGGRSSLPKIRLVERKVVPHRYRTRSTISKLTTSFRLIIPPMPPPETKGKKKASAARGKRAQGGKQDHPQVEGGQATEGGQNMGGANDQGQASDSGVDLVDPSIISSASSAAVHAAGPGGKAKHAVGIAAGVAAAIVVASSCAST